MTRAVVFIVGALVSAMAAAVLAGPEQQAQFIVAYMTSDGELVPVARYDGKAWRNTWPEMIEFDAPLPVSTIDKIPRAWLGQPVPMTWTTWSLFTGKQQPARVTGIDRDGSCFQAITLATSFKPDPASDGLAFNKPTRVDPVIQLDPQSADSDQLRRDVAPHFRAAVANSKLLHGVGEDQIGSKLPAVAHADKFADDTVVVTAILRDPNLPIFFIEAERQFQGLPAGTELDALSYSGWFRRGAAGALVPIDASVFAFSSGGEGKLPRYEPIGIVHFGARSIWVMSAFGLESQTIVLFDVSAHRVRKLTSAEISGC